MLYIKFNKYCPDELGDSCVIKCGRMTTTDHSYLITSQCEPTAQMNQQFNNYNLTICCIVKQNSRTAKANSDSQ